MHQPMQQPHNMAMAPLHGSSGRLGGMGGYGSGSGGGGAPPDASPEMRGYHSHPGERCVDTLSCLVLLSLERTARCLAIDTFKYKH